MGTTLDLDLASKSRGAVLARDVLAGERLMRRADTDSLWRRILFQRSPCINQG